MPRTKPILFSGPMIRALLDGRKTQTRRVLKVSPTKKPGSIDDYMIDRVNIGPLPYKTGDLLWVRERWSDELLAPGEVYYYATALEDGLRADEVAEIRWRPSIHMPRWASRITLEVTDVRVHRLQDISYDDAIAEGIEPVDEFPAGNQRWRDYLGTRSGCSSPILSFSTLWDSINAKRGFSYHQNPWVIALTFVVHNQGVDELLAARAAA